MEALMRGCTNKDIAADLQLSTRTVKAHLHKMFRVYNCDGYKRVDLIRRRINGPTLKFRDMSILTTKEQDVVVFVALGYRNCEIARYLHISEDYVKNMLRLIFDKTGMNNRVELMLWAING